MLNKCVVHYSICFFLVLQKDSTPLHRGAAKGHSEVVQSLVSKGADLEAKNKVRGKKLHDCTCSYNNFFFLF